MEKKICLDTDFLVNFLRNKKEEVEFIIENDNNILATTLINLFELYHGVYKYKEIQNNLMKLEELASRLIILNLSQESVKKAGQIASELEKSGNSIEFRDLLIGCVAQEEGYCLKTNNKKHFERILGLILV